MNNKVDILLISGIKIDSPFPISQFFIQGYLIPYRLDRTVNGGGMLLYIRDGIISTLIQREMQIEGTFVELNLRKKMALTLLLQPKEKLNIQSSKKNRKNIDTQSSNYENFSLLRDFNSEPIELVIEDFRLIYSCLNIIHDKTLEE